MSMRRGEKNASREVCSVGHKISIQSRSDGSRRKRCYSCERAKRSKSIHVNDMTVVHVMYWFVYVQKKREPVAAFLDFAEAIAWANQHGGAVKNG